MQRKDLEPIKDAGISSPPTALESSKGLRLGDQIVIECGGRTHALL